MSVVEHTPTESDPDVLGGKLVFYGTRVPVQSLIDYLDDGFTVDEFVEYFPSVDKDDIEAFLKNYTSRR